MPMIVAFHSKKNYMFELKNILEYDEFLCKENIWSIEFAWRHSCIFTCPLPFLPSITTFLGPNDGFMQN
jgi:hypothetical protein